MEALGLLLQLILAVAPLVKQLLDLYINTPKEKRKEFMAQLPLLLKEISDAIALQVEKKDPSAVNRILNRK